MPARLVPLPIDCVPRMSSSRVPLLLLSSFLLLAGLLAACGDGSSSSDVEVVEPSLVQTPSGDRVFTGTFVNRRSTSISIAQVEVALYDAEGAPLGSMRIEVGDVPAQDSVEFKQTIDSERPIEQAQVQSILLP